jgi:hypothetical protein
MKSRSKLKFIALAPNGCRWESPWVELSDVEVREILDLNAKRAPGWLYSVEYAAEFVWPEYLDVGR